MATALFFFLEAYFSYWKNLILSIDSQENYKGNKLNVCPLKIFAYWSQYHCSALHKALHQFSKYDSVELAEEAREEFEEEEQERHLSSGGQEEASLSQEESQVAIDDEAENVPVVDNSL